MVAAIGVAILIFFTLVVVFLFAKRGKNPVATEEEIPLEEENTECSEEIKKRLQIMQQELLKEVQQLYAELKKIKIPPEAQADYSNFLRIYNIVKEMDEEIKIYPSSNCEKYFLEKIDFYRKLTRELHKKIKSLST